jgi:hypothetical protein
MNRRDAEDTEGRREIEEEMRDNLSLSFLS